MFTQCGGRFLCVLPSLTGTAFPLLCRRVAASGAAVDPFRRHVVRSVSSDSGPLKVPEAWVEADGHSSYFHTHFSAKEALEKIMLCLGEGAVVTEDAFKVKASMDMMAAGPVGVTVRLFVDRSVEVGVVLARVLVLVCWCAGVLVLVLVLVLLLAPARLGCVRLTLLSLSRGRLCRMRTTCLSWTCAATRARKSASVLCTANCVPRSTFLPRLSLWQLHHCWAPLRVCRMSPCCCEDFLPQEVTFRHPAQPHDPRRLPRVRLFPPQRRWRGAAHMVTFTVPNSTGL